MWVTAKGRAYLYEDGIIPELADIPSTCLIGQGKAILIAGDVCQDGQIQRVDDIDCLHSTPSVSLVLLVWGFKPILWRIEDLC